MNTIEIKFNDEIKTFSEMFSLARDQFVNYEKIEGIENWEDYDFSIDCAEDQLKFKDMLQIRFIEELTEASIAIPEPEEHFWEEIGDALNFFLSAYLMLNIDFDRFRSPSDFLYKGGRHKLKINDLKDFSLAAYPVIENVGALCNLLKNRPWAMSNYLVSIYDFDIRLEILWNSFWAFLGNMCLSERDVFEMFWKKYKVNQHRIESGY